MSIISTNMLFHFTRNLDTLLKIIENGFRPSYCKEFVYETIGGKIKEVKIAMVCCCDLPLSMLGKHVDRYGSYGLGMNKTEKNWVYHLFINSQI